MVKEAVKEMEKKHILTVDDRIATAEANIKLLNDQGMNVSNELNRLTNVRQEIVLELSKQQGMLKALQLIKEDAEKLKSSQLEGKK